MRSDSDKCCNICKHLEDYPNGVEVIFIQNSVLYTGTITEVGSNLVEIETLTGTGKIIICCDDICAVQRQTSGNRIYVVSSNNVSVIDGSTNSVIATVPGY